MATPTIQPPLTPEQRLALEEKQRTQRILRNVAIGGAIACPIIILMPPRKLDLYTFSLGIGFYLSADHLCEHYTGRGFVQQFIPATVADPMPTEKAREMQRKIAEEREKGRKALGAGPEQNSGVLQKLWMGDEKEGWRERRLEEEKKAMEEGKSFSDMIFEQVWDVWNWDKKGKNGEKKE
jgi:hypothetical protein